MARELDVIANAYGEDQHPTCTDPSVSTARPSGSKRSALAAFLTAGAIVQVRRASKLSLKAADDLLECFEKNNFVVSEVWHRSGRETIGCL